MRRREAVVLLCYAIVSVTAGVTWLFGPFGLIGVGLVLAVAALLFDFKEE